MEIKSLTCWTEPLHFQLPPTKNLRASREDVEWMARLAAAAALTDAEEASLAAVLESMMNDLLKMLLLGPTEKWQLWNWIGDARG